MTALAFLVAWIALDVLFVALLARRARRRRAAEALAVFVPVPIGPGVQGAIPGTVLSRVDHEPAGGGPR